MDIALSDEKRSRVISIAGLAMMWPCVHNQLLYPASFAFPGQPGDDAFLLYAIYIALLLPVTAIFIFARRSFARNLLGSRQALSLIGCLGVAGIAIIIFWPFTNDATSIAVMSVGMAFMALYVPTFFLFWSCRLASASQNVATDAALSYAVFCGISAIRLLLGVHAWVFSLAYAVISTVLAWKAVEEPLKNYSSQWSTLRMLPMNLVVPSILFVYLGLLIMQPFTPANALFEYPPNRAILYFVNALLFALIAQLYSSVKFGGGKVRLKVFILLCTYLALMLLVTGFAVIASPVDLGNFPIIAGKNTFECFLLIVALSAARYKRFDPLLPTALLLGLVIAPCDFISACVASIASVDLHSMDVLMLVGATILAAFFVLALANMLLVVLFSRPGASRKTNPDSISDIDRKLIAMKDTFSLSDREMDIVRLAHQNASAKKIAEDLFIAESTAYTHLKRIYRKVDVHSKQELIDLIDTMGQE